MLRGDHWVSSRFPSLVQFPLFGVAIWGPGRVIEVSNPNRTEPPQGRWIINTRQIFREVTTKSAWLNVRIKPAFVLDAWQRWYSCRGV